MKMVLNLVGLKIFSNQFEDISTCDSEFIDNNVFGYELIRYIDLTKSSQIIKNEYQDKENVRVLFYCKCSK